MMRGMRALLSTAVIGTVMTGCGSGAWKPVVWATGPVDAKSTPVAFEFAPNTNGTELVLAVLGHAKTSEATGISAFEIQVGACTRSVTMAPARGAAPAVADPALDRITLRVQELSVRCRTYVEQEVQHGGSEPKKLGDAQLVEKQACDKTPIDHVVTRYRFELDAKFTPPDWAELERVHHAKLAFGPPRCGSTAKNEVRAVLHAASQPAPPHLAPPPDAAAQIIDLATRAEAAELPGAATDFAERALAALAAAPELVATDQLADRIAAALFFAVAIDVDKFLHGDLPKGEATPEWVAQVGAEIDRIAKRYEHIKELVQLPLVVPWLHAGARELAKLHEHTAMLLEAAHQTTAAANERAKATALREQAGH